MRASIISAISLFAIGSLAAPETRNLHPLSDAAALKVANNFKGLISAYSTALANSVLTSDVVDYSDSVETLIDGACPDGPVALGTPTFSSLAAFEAGQGKQRNIDFELLNVWHNAKTVTVRWRSSLPNPGPGPAPAVQEQVTGILVLETRFNGWYSAQPFLIAEIFSEFNSGAWLYDLKVINPTCPPPPPSKRSIAEALPAMLVRGRSEK